MPPTTPPIIINMSDTGAPWWGVPLLAGLFVIIGALVAFFSTRASDRRKAENDKETKQLSHTREAAEALLKVGNDLEMLVKEQETKTRARPANEYLDLCMEHVLKLKEVWAAYELVSVKSTLKPGEGYFAALLLLAMPTADSTKRTALLNAEATRRMDFINSLRTTAGLEKIDRTPGQVVPREDIDKDEAQKKAFLEAAAELITRHPVNHDKAKDGGTPKEPEPK